jgi:hypothetical protein
MLVQINSAMNTIRPIIVSSSGIIRTDKDKCNWWNVVNKPEVR